MSDKEKSNLIKRSYAKLKRILKFVLSLAVLLTVAVVLYFGYFADFVSDDFSTNFGKDIKNRIYFAVDEHLEHAGFVLKDADAKGYVRTSPDQILKTADIFIDEPIFDIDLKEIHKKLSMLPWVKEVYVYRSLPSTIKIDIVEHKPIAVWINENKKYPVSSEGILLTEDAESDDLEKLPVVFGKNGYKKFPEILEIVNTEPELAERAKVFNYVGERSWKVRFDNPVNGIWVYLPDTDVKQAWHRMKIYEKNYQLLKRKLTIIDLRLPDKLVVRIENDRKNAVLNGKKKSRLILKEQQA